MNIRAVFMAALAASIVLSGCASQERDKSAQSSRMALNNVAAVCSRDVEAMSKGLPGRIDRRALIRREGTYVTFPDGTRSNERFSGIVYIESTAVDGGEPGSAWRSCMAKKGILL